MALCDQDLLVVDIGRRTFEHAYLVDISDINSERKRLVLCQQSSPGGLGQLICKAVTCMEKTKWKVHSEHIELIL